MSRSRRKTALSVALASALVAPLAHAVRLGEDGLGQALIYPYYSVQQSNGDAYNTYISIVSHSSDAKAVRVRIREGRASREVASFNLFLSPNDVWTGAIVPGGDGARLITNDPSCADGLQAGATKSDPSFVDFRNTAFGGTGDDGNGTGLDRTREGFVEMIEMATLTGASAAAITHTSAGVPANCAAVTGAAAVTVTAPSGGLSGTLTLINVANGLNFDLNATALADLSKRPYYRAASDPYPDFNAAEIDAVSSVVANGALYRSTWSRPVDAVSAVLMHPAFLSEYVLDDATDSNTDVVATFPTREFYVSTTSARPPFTLPSTWAPHCEPGGTFGEGEMLGVTTFSREEGSRAATTDCGFLECPPGPPPPLLCAATVVADMSNGSTHTAIASQTRVLGSLVRGYGPDGISTASVFTHGWLRGVFSSDGPARLGLTSLADSARMDLATGAVTTGPQVYYGLPLIGFTARTFMNGTLTCNAGACQGNYGGAFPFQYTRKISP